MLGEDGVELFKVETGLGKAVLDAGFGRYPPVPPAQLHRVERSAGLQQSNGPKNDHGLSNFQQNNDIQGPYEEDDVSGCNG